MTDCTDMEKVLPTMEKQERTPVKRANVQSRSIQKTKFRTCLICRRQLLEFKKYYNVTEIIAEKMSSASGLNLHYDKSLSQMKVCGPCKSKVESVNKWKDIGLSLKQTFVECGLGETGTPPSTPVSSARVKRMSVDSPTTLQARLVKKGRPSPSTQQLQFTDATSVNNNKLACVPQVPMGL